MNNKREDRMDVILRRDRYTIDGVFGTLTDRDDNVIAITLEHSYPTVVGKFQAKVPSGDYVCRRRYSPRFRYDVFEILDVPKCTYIEIHVGNYNRDSEGCVLLGRSVGMDPDGHQMIKNSRGAFSDFMNLQDNNDEFNITIIDNLPVGSNPVGG